MSHAVRPDEVDAALPGNLQNLGLHFASRLTCFSKAGGNDNRRFNALGGALTHDTGHQAFRHDDYRQVNCVRNIYDTLVSCFTHNLRGIGIDRINALIPCVKRPFHGVVAP